MKTFKDALKKVTSDKVKLVIETNIIPNQDKEGNTRKPSNQILSLCRTFLDEKEQEQLNSWLLEVGLAITRGGANDSIEMQLARKTFQKAMQPLVQNGNLTRISNTSFGCRDALGNEVVITINIGKKKPSQQSTKKAS